MAELIGGSGYDDVQNTAPSSPSVGDTWLDTSTDPPTGKVYADLGSGGQWTTGLLDQQISEAGASVSDIKQGVNDSKTANLVEKNSIGQIKSVVYASTSQFQPFTGGSSNDFTSSLNGSVDYSSSGGSANGSWGLSTDDSGGGQISSTSSYDLTGVSVLDIDYSSLSTSANVDAPGSSLSINDSNGVSKSYSIQESTGTISVSELESGSSFTWSLGSASTYESRDASISFSVTTSSAVGNRLYIQDNTSQTFNSQLSLPDGFLAFQSLQYSGENISGVELDILDENGNTLSGDVESGELLDITKNYSNVEIRMETSNDKGAIFDYIKLNWVQ